MTAPPTRLKAIAEHVDAKASAILEIGALDSPTFRQPDYRVKYADYTSTDELAKKGQSDPRYKRERLVEVDYPVDDLRYTQHIDERFDLIVANHVVEHVPDTIGWLGELGQLLKPGGVLFLSVPDKRYTFDIVRRETNFIDLLRTHLNKQTRPDFFNILDHLWHHKAVSKDEVWNGTHQEKLKKNRFSPADALKHAHKLSGLPYADVHCHVFTETSFAETILTLRDFGYVGFRDCVTGQVARGSNEFYAVLKNYQAGGVPRA